ncbi:MAG TPA: hypothetical protein VIX90_12900 [Edaphobacter sp.]
MKIHIQVAVFALTAVSVGALGQCAKPGLNPYWDAGKSQFKCIDPAAVKGSVTDESVSPKGDKDHCNKVQENLLKVCPQSGEGKTCRDRAKSLYKACYKGSNDGREDRSGSTGTANQLSNTDTSVCMTIFTQQQQACQSRKLPPPSPGQPYVPDTCLQDAVAAQNKCLANSR